MKLLPMPFTWQDFLDWAEDTHPDAPYDQVCNTFEACKRMGMVREAGVRDDGEILYEKGVNHPHRIVFLVKEKP